MSTLPTNIVRDGEPSRSALTVASLRAVHQLLDEPLVFPDPIGCAPVRLAGCRSRHLCVSQSVQR